MALHGQLVHNIDILSEFSKVADIAACITGGESSSLVIFPIMELHLMHRRHTNEEVYEVHVDHAL